MTLSLNLSSMITDMVMSILSETLGGYMAKHGEEETLREVKSTFQYMVENDVDFVSWVSRNKPHWFKYLRRVRRIRYLIRWDTERFAREIERAMEDNGIPVDGKGRSWLRKTLEQVRKLIYE